MSDKKLLVDFRPFEYDKQMLTESAQKPGPLTVSGILQRAEAKNQNGRVYPKPILEREAKKYIERRVNQRRALGELDHPDSSVVNLKNVSHNIIDLKWEGNDLIGEVQILSTPAGNILKSLFEAGVNVGISSRGLGSVKENHDGSVTVDEDFELIAFDFVSEPSTHGAFMAPINEHFDQKRIKEMNKWSNVNKLVQEIIQQVGYEYDE